MIDFLASLSALVVFYGIAVLASLVLVVQIGLALLGFDDVDGTDFEAGDGLSFLSLRSLVGFFGGLGWTGAIMLQNGASFPTALALGIAVGFLFMLSIAYIMKALYSFGESGTIDINNAVGETGTVYITVPADRSGTGQVRVMVQGRLKMFSALTTAPDSIRSERKIRVTGLVDSETLLVEPLDQKQEGG